MLESAKVVAPRRQRCSAAVATLPHHYNHTQKSYGAGAAVGVALLRFLQRSVRRVPLLGELAGVCVCVCACNALAAAAAAAVNTQARVHACAHKHICLPQHADQLPPPPAK